jgi:hypothetical protein
LPLMEKCNIYVKINIDLLLIVSLVYVAIKKLGKK